MQQEGPILESLTRRLAETPADFLAEPRIGPKGRVHVAAVVADLLRLFGAFPTGDQWAGAFTTEAPAESNRLAISLLLCWLLADDWFRQRRFTGDQLLGLLEAAAKELTDQVTAPKFISDPDRREELVRMVLAGLGFRPAGESLAQAQDRLTTLNSAERARVMLAAQAAEKRGREIREALARKAAEESADKWTRE